MKNFLLFVATLFLLALPVSAAPDETLRNIEKFRVLVEDIPEAARRGLGMNREQLTAFVSARLRSQKIPLADFDDYSAPMVYIRIGALHDDYFNRYSWTVTLHVRDLVYLSRTSEIHMAILYEDGTYGLASSPRFKEAILGAVDSAILKLAVDWGDSNI